MEWKKDGIKRIDHKNGPCERGEFLPGLDSSGDWQEVEYAWGYGFGTRGGDGIGGEFGRGDSAYLCRAVQYRGQAARSVEDVFGKPEVEVRDQLRVQPEEQLQLGGVEEDFLTQKFRSADRLRELLVLKGDFIPLIATERMMLEFTPDEVDLLVSASEVLKEHYTDMEKGRRENGIIAAAKFVLDRLGGVN